MFLVIPNIQPIYKLRFLYLYRGLANPVSPVPLSLEVRLLNSAKLGFLVSGAEGSVPFQAISEGVARNPCPLYCSRVQDGMSAASCRPTRRHRSLCYSWWFCFWESCFFCFL
ncbi:hypothetical protein XENTR_v10015294 [Xenopus tropicalis]|nr:hypothetical protein XENTR_v10015294 [Xenopus tropicalis]